jgi:large subunit ribosomal protein L21
MTFAVIKTGGKQYKVAANDVLKIEKLDAEPGDVVTFDQVLMVGNGDAVTVGTPVVDGALVAGHLLATEKQGTVIVFKKRRRHNSRRRNGHRQLLSSVRITEIVTGGAAVTTVADAALKQRLAARAAALPGVAQAPAGKPAAAPAPLVDAQLAGDAADEAPKAARPRARAKADESGIVDDIKLIGGIGPTLEKKLNGAGVTSLRQIAQWTGADIDRFDAELELRGRATRDEWVEQARDLLAGKPPRAKADQDLAAAEKTKK